MSKRDFDLSDCMRISYRNHSTYIAQESNYRYYLSAFQSHCRTNYKPSRICFFLLILTVAQLHNISLTHSAPNWVLISVESSFSSVPFVSFPTGAVGSCCYVRYLLGCVSVTSSNHGNVLLLGFYYLTCHSYDRFLYNGPNPTHSIRSSTSRRASLDGAGTPGRSIKHFCSCVRYRRMAGCVKIGDVIARGAPK